MLRNDYSRETDTFEFTDVGIVSGGISCSEHYGSGLFDLAVRFADIDGMYLGFLFSHNRSINNKLIYLP